MTRPTRYAVVTGASKGIGAAIARGLAEDGFSIWLNYSKDHDSAKLVKKDIEKLGVACRLIPFDVANQQASAKAVEEILTVSTPFVLVNNAGFTRDGMFGLMPPEDWTQVMDVHLGGFYNMTRHIVPHMQRQRAGRIINIVSTSGQTGTPGQVNYSTAKAGLIGATKALSREIARRNVLVNAVSPGFIETEMISELPLDAIIPNIPLGRLGKPEDVAKAVSFLCSSGGDYITGQVLAVNGGIC